MTPENHAMLTGWLESGDESQKTHARNRLAMPDAIGYEPPAYPSYAAMAGNAVKAAAAFVASGFAVASDEEQGRRIAICHGCEKFDHAQGRCTICGCAGGWKAWVASSHCPLDKW